MKQQCVWIYRNGTNNSHWAKPSCGKPGEYNFLSKIYPSEPAVGVADWYNGKACPRCGKEIIMHYPDYDS